MADTVRDALLAFVRAYANVEQIPRGEMEVRIFQAWLRGVDALGIVAEIPSHVIGKARTRSDAAE